MTSTANQQNPTQATTSAPTAPSYASAAGAPKKSTPQQPVVVAGSLPPVVVAPASPAQKNAKSVSPAPVNGKPPAVAPAVPAVARGTSNGAHHSRHSSVTMAANGPNSFNANGGSVGGAKSGIQFGFDSPAITHSTPQTGSSAPIPIPGGNARVPSPANSPSPIPQPSASGGGRPPSGLTASNSMTFGSIGSDGEVSLYRFPSVSFLPHSCSTLVHLREPDSNHLLQRHMRQGSIPAHNGPATHFRRESNHSVQGDHAGRGNFSQGGRGGRGYNSHANNYNNQMGFPPNNQYRNNGGPGRGGMPPSFQPQQQRNLQYPNSPQPNHRSPALVNSMPGNSMPGTPNMPPANMQPNMAMQTPPQHHYSQPLAPQYPQVQLPFSSIPHKQHQRLPKKSLKARRDNGRPYQPGRRSDPAREMADNEFSADHRGYHNRSRPLGSEDEADHTLTLSSGNSQTFPPHHQSDHDANPDAPAPVSLDMSPGNYEQLLLTMKRQNFGYPPQGLDQYGRPYGQYNMQYMPPPQANSPAYNQGFVPPPYQQHQHSHSMSRTPSQPERPPSVNQQGPAVAMGSNAKQTPSSSHAQPSLSFQRPKKSGAIPIKTASGEVLDTASFKVPPSPAPSSQQTKTPPVATSTPTPPPKTSTPAHGRTDSSATAQKTAKQIQDELKEKIKQATQGASKPKEEKPVEAKPVEAKPAEVKPAVVEAAPEPKAATPAPAEPAKVSEPIKAETPVKAEEPEPKPQEVEKPAAPTKQEDPDEDEMERIIREMEEEDARREKQQEEYRIKKEAEKAAAKAKEDANRLTPADEDRKLREQEAEMERLEEEKEKRRQDAEASGKVLSVSDLLAGKTAPKETEPAKVDAVADKLAGMKLGGEKPSTDPKLTTAEKRGAKPTALNLAPLNTKPVEPPQPTAALQSLQSARFLQVMGQDIYPEGIKSPNPALNAAVAKKGKTFQYDASFLLQFQKVFTEQPSLEFHQQVKSLIGDGEGRSASSRGAQTPGSARQGSRGGGAGFNMGAFNAPPGGRTLPTGTSSAERFAMSSGSMARPQVAPMNSFQRPGGAFPMSTSMSRTSSQSNMGSNAPRQSSRRGGGSRRDTGVRDAQAAKTMPLTAGMEIKPIAVSTSGWKPSSIGKGPSATPAGNAHMDPEMVQRKVKAALNKMTPENFERISDQILVITSQSKDETDGRTLRQVIQLTFEKATDEAHWASMYAKFCKKMLETMSAEIKDERIKDKNGNIVSGGPLFRKYLLNRCQEEFERGWAGAPQPEGEEKPAEQKPGEAVMLSEEYYKAAAAKRRGLGLVQFIGELYKLGMLTERIMLECVHKLVDHKGIPDEAEIESLSKLLRTIGAHLDQSEKGRPMMDVYFGRIIQMVEAPELASRLKFMLMDVVDLRRTNWQSKEANKGPKTLDEVRAEAEAAQAAKAAENARSNQRGGGRPQGGRGDGRNFSAGYTQQTSNQVGMDDLRRLKGSANRTTSGNVTLGPSSMFSSRSNSGRRIGPGGSLGRPGDDSGNTSRTGTPPVRDSASHSNAFR